MMGINIELLLCLCVLGFRFFLWLLISSLLFSFLLLSLSTFGSARRPGWLDGSGNPINGAKMRELLASSKHNLRPNGDLDIDNRGSNWMAGGGGPWINFLGKLFGKRKDYGNFQGKSKDWTAWDIGHNVPFQCLKKIAQSPQQLRQLNSFQPNLQLQYWRFNQDHQDEQFPLRNLNSPQGRQDMLDCENEARRVLADCKTQGKCH